MDKKILIIALVVVLIGAGWFFFSKNYANGPTLDDGSDITNETPVPGNEDVDEMVVDDDGGAAGTVPAGEPIITYTDDGFSPSELTVAVGAKVKFQNNSSVNFWPASAMHPTHTVYPGSNISKCGTDEEPNIFDACKGIAPGGTYVFTFDEVGEWRYHDHLKASEFWKVIVVAD